MAKRDKVAGGIKGVYQLTLKLGAYLAGFEVGRRCPPLEAAESQCFPESLEGATAANPRHIPRMPTL